jgi:hypothetical protein
VTRERARSDRIISPFDEVIDELIISRFEPVGISSTVDLHDLTAWCPGRPRTRRATRLRRVSVFRQGWVALLVALLRHDPLPQGCLVPESWPTVPVGEEEADEPETALPEAA